MTFSGNSISVVVLGWRLGPIQLRQLNEHKIMTSLNLSLLGPPQIELDGKSITIRRSKVLALLVYLDVTGEPQRRDTLATLLWPDSSQQRARAALRNELSILNQLLGAASRRLWSGWPRGGRAGTGE